MAGDKGGRCVGLTTLPPSCADCLEILGASTFWILKGLSRPVMGLLYLHHLALAVTKRSCEGPLVLPSLFQVMMKIWVGDLVGRYGAFETPLYDAPSTPFMLPVREIKIRSEGYFVQSLNLLTTKRRLLYLKTQSVPRCKHFSSRL